MKDFLLRRAQKPHSRAQRWMALIGSGILFWLIVPLVLIVLSLWLTLWLTLPMFSVGQGLLLTGMAMMLAGALLDFWVIYYQHVQGEGTPSPLVPTQRLVQEGPFAFSRNPMYIGTLTMYTGLALTMGSVAMLLLVALGALLVHGYVVLVEEKEMAARFGDEYREYQKRVPRWLPLRWKRD